MSVIWLNGQLVAADEARIPALDRGVLTGVGLFETLRAYGGKPWALDDHHARLMSGAELIDLDVPSGNELRAAIDVTLRANELSDAGVRFTITGGTGPVDPQAEADSPPNVIVTAWPLRDFSELYAKGASFVTISEGGRPLAGVKTTSYAVSVAGRIAARRAGADDALFLGGHKRVLESTGSNLFVVRGNELVTPAIEDAILPGVTRRYVIDVARAEGLEVNEATIYLDDLHSADEVILTSSLREVYPAASLDGSQLKIGGHAARLREAYHDFVLKSLGVSVPRSG